MKKEAVNSFDGGLNYDLNPITTPANVLTDCVNGTFITFNGDELALQNDAGNTKIKAPDWTEEIPKYVSLTDGFNPIGIKEFGGVLYIVSANKDTNQVEFGSYPSPQILTEESVGNGIPFTFNDPTKNSLFTSNVLNNYIFKAGEYAVFESVDLDLSNVTRYRYSGNLRISAGLRIYNVKLYLQLTNGFIDLTTDVWNEYARFKGGELNDQFWFNDPNFKYYCKNNFKGKLVLSVELEDLPVFQLNYYNLDQIDGQGYQATFNISINNQTTWNIEKIRIFYSLDSWTNQSFTDIILGSPTSDYTLNIPFYNEGIYNEGKTLEFRIIPVFCNPATTDDITTELPDIYLDKYTLLGSELLTNVFNYDSNDYEGYDYY